MRGPIEMAGCGGIAIVRAGGTPALRNRGARFCFLLPL